MGSKLMFGMWVNRLRSGGWARVDLGLGFELEAMTPQSGVQLRLLLTGPRQCY